MCSFLEHLVSSGQFSVIVVESALHDHEALAIHSIDESVLLGDSSRPPAFEIVFERLRFAYSGKGIPQRITDDFIDPMKNFAIAFLPVEIVFPAVGQPGQSHSSPDWTLPSE